MSEKHSTAEPSEPQAEELTDDEPIESDWAPAVDEYRLSTD
ncbi:hypothetical protein AB0G67_36745 [Streptomyces sp. NPDC021056]